MILLVFTTLSGGALTFALLLPYGALIALAGAPFGASALALLGALFLTQRPRRERADATPYRAA